MLKLLNCYAVTVLFAASAVAAGAESGSFGPAREQPAACQTAVLRNGSSLHYERRDDAGPYTRLWLCEESGSGFFEIPSEQIERFAPPEHGVAAATSPNAPPVNEPHNAPASQLTVKELITTTALRHGIDPDFITSVVKAESDFNPQAVSSKGARGLMQLMPQTAADLGVENSFDPVANIEGGTKYLRELLDQYGGDAVKALAAYNAGPLRVQQYGGVPPYRETLAYITHIIDDYKSKKIEKQPAANLTR